MYALMRTWAAHEMSRPGCVWTHVLIVSFSDISRFIDLSVLMNYFVRPSLSIDFNEYSSPIFIEPLSLVFNNNNVRVRKLSIIKKIVNSLYYTDEPARIVSEFGEFGEFGEFDDSIFAVWSQQWPRLRRNFSFRTAAGSGDFFIGEKTFDLTILVGNNYSIAPIPHRINSDILGWERYTLDDLISEEPTAFRRFMWRYGSDILLGRRGFKFLASIYSVTRRAVLDGEVLFNILSAILKFFPSVNDAKNLKVDLVEGGQYSLLPSVDYLDLIEFYIKNPISTKLPILPEKAFEYIQDNWIDKSKEIIFLSELAFVNNNEIGDDLLRSFIKLINSSDFLYIKNNNSNLMDKILTIEPYFLKVSDLGNMESNDILMLLKYLPDNDEVLVNAIISTLLSIDDFSIVIEIYNRFPVITLRKVIAEVEAFNLGGGYKLANSWLDILAETSTVKMMSEFICTSKSTSALSLYASVIKYDLSSEVTVWSTGLGDAIDNLRGNKRKPFLIFILTLALRNRNSDCERLFEFAFEEVYQYLKYSQLTWEQKDNLLYYVPALSGIFEWDSCLRLCNGIVRIYIENGLKSDSFKRLTKEKCLFSKLLNIAGGTEIGRSYINSIND
ncbi:hypothetical protein CRN84_16875 [Budvicia aquatica]|uniref:Uncharacterized protein n=3 Tax=Budvicia aquatica TaxID=82979 RepID=A0A2C6DQ14_9GAMM|nr:hypothetical protein CRN84_16875 [Budvicia aquatica]